MIQIVTSRLPNDTHDWVLVRGGKYKCALCEYTMPTEPLDVLVFRSGCAKSKVAIGAHNAV